MLSADDKPTFSNFFKKIHNSNFYCHIWIQHETFIWIITNKPSIGGVGLRFECGKHGGGALRGVSGSSMDSQKAP